MAASSRRGRERGPALATREDHDAFCQNEEWVLVRGATGRPVQGDRTYELTLWDGRVLRTRIQRPVGESAYAPGAWSHILRQQLVVSAEEFWACAREGVRPDRGEPIVRLPRQPAPAHVLRALRRLGVDEQRLLDLDAAAAEALHARLLLTGAAGALPR